ncbi:hypothetical protein AVEN_24311-1 [Araneus ventricosus]|uniref:Uncharacterized protein n=1 Tax=Araneus ventricosus TaxID=182803 RepID=A0A4Y2PEG3_ARAVE|nr:hypothetical protein AVEN_24311-1 [Araneus ventricosus]
MADEVAKEGSAEPLDNRGLLTYSKIFSKVRADNNRTWTIPPVHDWYQQKHPGAALELKGARIFQTTITRIISGQLCDRHFPSILYRFRDRNADSEDCHQVAL